MSEYALQMVSVNCPACRAPFSAPVQSVIDVGQEPRLKSLLLQGQLNVGVCPQCGAGGRLGVPLLYHDPAKDLLFCLVPQELRMSESERQRAIGEMSNAVINHLPADQRRGYLLQPRVFLTMQTLMEAILEADGITREMLQAQQERARLIGEMLDAVDDPLRLAALIGKHEDKVDYDLFALLTANIQLAEQSPESDSAAKLAKLREALLERTETGQQVGKQQAALEKAVEGLDEDLTREQLLGRIIAAEGEHQDEVLHLLISVARPLVDYQFFQLLTSRVDEAEIAGDSGLSERLKALRARILDLTQELDAEFRERMQEKARLLTEILKSADPRAAVRAHAGEIDTAFMSLLDANIEQSHVQQQSEAEKALRSVREAVVEMLQESVPPEVRYIDQLLQAEYPEETRKMLADSRAMINADLLAAMEALSQSLANRGDQETSQRLAGIRAQAELLQ